MSLSARLTWYGYLLYIYYIEIDFCQISKQLIQSFILHLNFSKRRYSFSKFKRNLIESYHFNLCFFYSKRIFLVYFKHKMNKTLNGERRKCSKDIDELQAVDRLFKCRNIYPSNLQYQFQKLQMFQNGKLLQQINGSQSDQAQFSLSEGYSIAGVQISIKNDGLWSELEVFKFISYLMFNKQALKLKLQRRTSKVFKQMSLFIQSRTSVQCRSQNQRMFRKYKTMKNILSAFKEEYGFKRFEEDYDRIRLEPLIRFKTEYQDYIQQRMKKVNDVATQTDQTNFQYPSLTNFQPTLPLNYDYMVPVGGPYSNWVVIPFYS